MLGFDVIPILGLNVGFEVRAVGFELVEGLLVKLGLNVVGFTDGFDVVGKRLGSKMFPLGLSVGFELVEALGEGVESDDGPKLI